MARRSASAVLFERAKLVDFTLPARIRDKHNPLISLEKGHKDCP
ncbi:hypothetical protein [Alteromonas aquimaris]|nr:hypothetical protein [Alteromonas aquimaris]